MRITFILPTVNMSGGIRVAGIYAAALAEMGHRVVVVSPPPRAPTVKERLKELLTNQRWSTTEKAESSHLDGVDLDHRILDRWRAPTDDDVPDADVIIATWWETAEWVNALSDSKGVKIYFIQGYEAFPSLPVERINQTYRLPLHKIVIARWLARLMLDKFDAPCVDLVPNSVDHKLFHAVPRNKQAVPTVGFLYNPDSWKGAAVAMQAIDLLRLKYSNLRVISFGSTEIDIDLPLDPRIEFNLSPPQDQIRTLYAQCDVWIAASRSEGFNLTAMEAMACRTPVVSTRTGWPEEAIIDGVNGYLVEIDDAVALAAATDRVLAMAEADWKAMSAHAYATVETSSWQVCAKKFEQALHHARERAARSKITGACQVAKPLELRSAE